MQSQESDVSHERRKLELRLLEKLRAAESEYRLAIAEYKNLSGQSKDLGLQHPDGRQAFRNAIIVQREALKKYQAALRAFTALVVHGVAPPSDD
jgi:hypothetical protein